MILATAVPEKPRSASTRRVEAAVDNALRKHPLILRDLFVTVRGQYMRDVPSTRSSFEERV